MAFTATAGCGGATVTAGAVGGELTAIGLGAWPQKLHRHALAFTQYQMLASNAASKPSHDLCELDRLEHPIQLP
jgi:hypothetical protein